MSSMSGHSGKPKQQRRNPNGRRKWGGALVDIYLSCVIIAESALNELFGLPNLFGHSAQKLFIVIVSECKRTVFSLVTILDKTQL